MITNAVDLRSSAIACGHAANASAPILHAFRDMPEEPEDSGWKFLCGAEIEDWTQAQVWSIGEVRELVPDLASFLNRNSGASLIRSDEFCSWVEE